jgi:NAD(P)-dependent dehydrogenase (short-subunit alcohol dehydrogenase family)
MKTVVMTGATSGLGLVAAQRFVHELDTRLVVGARRTGSELDTLPLDLARLTSVRSFADALADTRIDALMLNAATQVPDINHQDRGRLRDHVRSQPSGPTICCCGC